MTRRQPEFQRIFLTFPSPKVVAFCLRAISSNSGCLQVPGDGDAAEARAVRVVGVDGLLVDAIADA